MELISFLEYIGVFVFAASGAICAIENRMDFFGILTLAAVTAMGGGVIRDVVTNIGIPALFSDYISIGIILLSTTLTIIFRGKIKWKTSFLLLDAIGLAVFTVAAGMKAIELHYNFLTFIFVSLITAIGGGVVRDILSKRVPIILKREIYAVASLIGSTVFWIISPWIGIYLSSYLCLTLIFMIRIFTYYYHIHLPYIENGKIIFYFTQKKSDD